MSQTTFRDRRAHARVCFFPTTFLEIAVYKQRHSNKQEGE